MKKASFERKALQGERAGSPWRGKTEDSKSWEWKTACFSKSRLCLTSEVAIEAARPEDPGLARRWVLLRKSGRCENCIVFEIEMSCDI